MCIKNSSRSIFVKLTASVFFLGIAVNISCTSAGKHRATLSKSDDQSSPAPLKPTPEMSQVQPVESQGLALEPTYTGEYVNSRFGYRVVIPDGLKGKGSPRPQQQHGFVINLSDKDQAILSVDASYNALLWRSLDEAYNTLYSYIREDSKSLDIEKKEKLFLDMHPALWFTIQYVDKKSGAARVTSQIISMRDCPGEDASQVLYTIEMNTLESRFEKDSMLMKQIFRSWKMLNKCE